MKRISIDSQIKSAYSGYRVQAIGILSINIKVPSYDLQIKIIKKNKNDLLFNDNRRIHE